MMPVLILSILITFLFSRYFLAYDFWGCVLKTEDCTKTTTSSGYKQIVFPELRGESGDVV